MLSVLRSRLKAGEMLVEFEYRNLVPLFAEENMKVCVRRDPANEERFDVWIEEPGGGYAVKGSALIDKSYILDTKSLKDTPGGEWLNNQNSHSDGAERRTDEEKQVHGASTFRIQRPLSN
jgi:hypothetical protein